MLGLAVAAAIAWNERGALDWLGIKWALVGRVFGTFAGAYAVTRLDHERCAVVLGVFVLLAVAISLSGWHVRPTTSTLVGAGMVSGVMGTLTSVGGPPMALVYQREQAAKLRSTLAGFFLFGASLALVTLAFSGELGGRQVVDGLVLLPGLARRARCQPAARPYLDRGWTRAAVLGLSTVTADRRSSSAASSEAARATAPRRRPRARRAQPAIPCRRRSRPPRPPSPARS